ncbi:MAG: hypothetical protein WD579_02585 [Candidatus Paceibacterota bacterium]
MKKIIFLQQKAIIISIVLGIVVILLFALVALNRDSVFPKSHDGVATEESAEFTKSIQGFVLENFGQPIDSGFTAPMYLEAFPGLVEADFDGVETSEGKYTYLDNELTFMRKKVGYISTFDEAILENGHKTLLNNLRARFGSRISVDEIITRITDDAETPFVSVGDTLGAMTVVSVAPFNHGQYSTDPKMVKIGPQNAKIILKGPIEITGTYSAVHSGIGFDGYCMSVTDVASLARLPVVPVRGTQPSISSYSFCFRNGEVVRQQLGEENRTITAEIDNFELNSYPAEVMSWADLVEVVRE